MNRLGNRDVESYVRSLVSDGFGEKMKDTGRRVDRSDNPVPKAHPLEPGQPDNRNKNQRNDSGS